MTLKVSLSRRPSCTAKRDGRSKTSIADATDLEYFLSHDCPTPSTVSMTGSEEHLAHHVPEDDEDIQDKIDKLNKFTENANFVSDSKSGIEQCAADPSKLGDRVRALLKALGFDKKVALSLQESI